MSIKQRSRRHVQLVLGKFVDVWCLFFFFSSRRRHTRYIGDWSSDVCSSDLDASNRVVIQNVAAVGAKPDVIRMVVWRQSELRLSTLAGTGWLTRYHFCMG